MPQNIYIMQIGGAGQVLSHTCSPPFQIQSEVCSYKCLEFYCFTCAKVLFSCMSVSVGPHKWCKAAINASM